MDPELKAYLDAISHNIRASMDAHNRSMLHTIDCVTAPVTASTDATELAIAGCVMEPVTPSSGATELATASAREAQLPALVPAIGEALGVAPVAPIDTITVVPASCSTECVAQAVTASTTTTLLPWVSGSSSSPDTSVTNDVVSTEVAHDNDAGKHGICEESSIADTNEHLALVVSSSSSSWQSIQAPVTTVALIQEGVPELSVEPMAVMSSPSTLNDYNLSTNGVPVAVVTLAIAGALPTVSVPVISAPIIQLQQLHNGSEVFQPSSSQHVISIVPVHRPSPWPSFMCVHADAPSESPSDAIMKPSWRCTSVAVNLLGNNNYSGNICISTSCITIHDMFSARELRCWNDVLLLLEYGWCGSACVPSAHTVVVMSCEHLGFDSTDFADSSLSAGSSVVGCSEFPVQSPIYFFIASESVTWLDTMDVHLLDFAGTCSALATICSACSQEHGHYLNNYQLKMLVISAGHMMILVRFQKGQRNSQVLLLPWVWEQEELSLGFQFQQHNILHDWYFCNQSIMASVLPDYSLKYNLLADTWRSRLLCVMSVCAAVHALVFPDSKDSRSWQSAQPAIGCDALLPIIQSVVLICMDYWWLTSAILTEMVSIFCAYHASKFRPVALLELQESTFTLSTSGTCQICKIPDYNKFSNSGHYQEEKYFSVGRLSYPVVKHNILDASHRSGEERALESFWKQEYGDVSFSSSFHMCSGMRMKPSEGFAELIQWLANNQKWNIQWDPGGCMFALCSSGKRWTPPMYCYEELQWSSLRLACAFQIRFVTGTIDGLQFFMCPGQAPFQGGRNAIAVTTFLEQVSASHDHDYYSYLGEAYPKFGYCDGSDKIKDRRLQWDPGGFSMMSAWGQAEFQGGRDVRSYPTDPPIRAGLLGLHMGLTQVRTFRRGTLQVSGGIRTSKPSKLDQANPTAASSPPTSALSFLSRFMLFILFPKYYTKTL